MPPSLVGWMGQPEQNQVQLVQLAKEVVCLVDFLLWPGFIEILIGWRRSVDTQCLLAKTQECEFFDILGSIDCMYLT
jgi:hypothetical protein